MESGTDPQGDSPAIPTGDSGGSGTGPWDWDSDPFVSLKTIDVLDAVRIRVPDIWASRWDEKAGKWCCGGDDPEDRSQDAGTFWIDFDVVDLGARAPAPGSPRAAEALNSMAQAVALEKTLTAAGDDAPALRVTPEGAVITYSERFNDGGGELIQYRWHMLRLVDRGLAVAHYSLILTEETIDRPAWKRLVETMDREIQAAAMRRPRPGSAPPRRQR